MLLLPDSIQHIWPPIPLTFTDRPVCMGDEVMTMYVHGLRVEALLGILLLNQVEKWSLNPT